METTTTEILLVHTTPDSKRSYGPFWRNAGKMAPLGASCLASIAPDRISVVDLQDHCPDERYFWQYTTQNLKAVLVQQSEDWDITHSNDFLLKLRALFPDCKLALVGENAKDLGKDWDVATFDTGLKLVLRFLRDIKTEGWIESSKYDENSFLPIPETKMFDQWGYCAEVEKSLKGKTIEIFRPWMGLIERCQFEKAVPDEKWLKKFLLWLNGNGYSSFYFHAYSYSEEFYQNLRAINFGLRTEFAIAFANIESAKVLPQIPGFPLKAIWIKLQGELAEKDYFLELSRQAKSSNLVLGADLYPDFSTEQANKLLKYFDSLAFKEGGNWKQSQLKKMVLKFWFKEGNFFAKLVRLRSIKDLISFLKMAYGIFDTILSANNEVTE
jgi:hypothetical protein